MLRTCLVLVSIAAAVPPLAAQDSVASSVTLDSIYRLVRTASPRIAAANALTAAA